MQADRASILWTTSAAGDGKVVVTLPDGGTAEFPAAVRALTPALTQVSSTSYQYQADLTDLQPGKRYGYRVMQNGVWLTPGPVFFQTAGPGKFSFLVFGDSGQNTTPQRMLVPLMNAEPDIAFLMHTGDLSYPQGTFALYETNYFGMNAPLFSRLPVFATPGNHDYLSDGATAFLACHAGPACGVDPADAGHYYSFDWGNAHFTYLDSNLMGTVSRDRMLDWLERDLGATRQFWKIVCLHHPPYPTGHHLGDSVCNAVRESINPILERYGVQLVLAGHEHGYERTAPLIADQPVAPGFGTTYVISGGGGADLHDVNSGGVTEFALETYHYLRVDVDGSSLTIRATALDGSEIERTLLRPKPVIPAGGIVSTGDFSPSIAAGSLVSIFGDNLAPASASATGTALPAELGDVRVEFEGKPIPLIYVSPGQVNAEIPYDAPAGGWLELFTANGSARAQLSLLPTAPSILAVTANGAIATRANAPSAGAPVVVYATGLGACRQVAAGNVTLSQTITPVDVLFDQWRIHPLFAGLTPGFAGLYQVNFLLPAAVTPGTYLLRLATPDALSRLVSVAVQ